MWTSDAPASAPRRNALERWPELIVVNGCPKSGNHAVMALFDTMGLRRHPGTVLLGASGPYVASMGHIAVDGLRSIPDNVFILGHVPASVPLDGFKVFMTLRDPRNVVLSYIAHRRRDGYIYGVPQALADFWGHPFVDVYRGYLGWRGRAVVLRYEDLPQHVVGDGRGIYRDHDYDWNTWTGRPSRWEDVWDDTAEIAWTACGGNELLAEAGYAR